MSSPFNPLANLTPANATPANAGLTPAHALTPSLALVSPNLPLLTASPGLGALAGLPGISSLPGIKSPPAHGTPWASISAAASAGAGTLSAPPAPPPGWVPFGAAGAAVGEADADNARRALSDVSRLLERAEVIRAEMGVLEKAVFSAGGGVEALPSLQLEYAQTLLALISLSSAYLVGALPVPLSAAAGYTPPPPDGEDGAASATAAAPPPPPPPAPPRPSTRAHALPTTTELAGWTEGRAQAQFARREAVRGASRAVLDVLNTR
ncbi:hypothetical protein CcaverHIS002_0302060 [Cutaneotrichosporon cavernicola]|uniref:Uncharacterized protein n=1 Tax=Cutaneotrichosporon cavernicola TaxID=279322 RepID=A0AA48I2Y0_9TREE|nr:uncharacterized protein CcaverHIS019_0302010 [Cutaneotrichosporon cavernicola]BEI82338.1 hypothetical protein CcaverHIS002_0302060 [Cutaneotrichosporon cavernicola]BEI90131.1 hypothetical protein CcaverHIS019_0302010 [Cutaneotrichosporon cavernicola]BEI97910.1 hypothetical protein CcaverHIS631_0302090 [Cutaneotrichosporon cavernicola]BEJ05688.1 hypothetical protein CcaverHIS641_0302100 [Cutaneotrichosporon cavernicola]